MALCRFLVVKWLGGKCTLYKQDMKILLFISKLYFFFIIFIFIIICIFEENYILMGNFKRHPGHTSIFLETVTIKFMGPRTGGHEKQIHKF